MAMWADAIDEAVSRLLDCSTTDDCGVSFIYNTQNQCSFCGYTQQADDYLLLRYYFFNDAPEENDTPWIQTPSCQVLNLGKKIELHLAPIGTALYRESPLICSLELLDDGLWISPSDEGVVKLQRNSDDKAHPVVRRQRLKTEIKKGEDFALHLQHDGVEGYNSHPVWKFKW